MSIDQTPPLPFTSDDYQLPTAHRRGDGAVRQPHAGLSMDQAGLVQSLQNRINQVETGQRIDTGKIISSGSDAINQQLPEKGYLPGTIVQWLTPQGSGYAVDYLSWLPALEACRGGQGLVVLDPWRQFNPSAIADLGFDIGNLIILRSGLDFPDVDDDFYWAIDQALRCPDVGAVWGPVGLVDQRWFRRFQLSAESSGCLGLFVQPMQAAKHPTWAEVQWWVTGPQTGALSDFRHEQNQHEQNHQHQRHAHHHHQRHQPVRLQLMRCRGASVGQSIEVSVNAITGAVR